MSGRICIHNKEIEVSLVIFDKDGTLVDFETMWGQRVLRAVDILVEDIGRPHVSATMLANVGFDPKTGLSDPEGPLSGGTSPQINAICAMTLYRAGYSWSEAEAIVHQRFEPIFMAPASEDEVLPLGDVRGLMAALKRGGIAVAVVTNDDRRPTEETLEILNITELIDSVICADDGFPPKPDPAIATHIMKQMAVCREKVIMIGDTLTDMAFARNAKIVWRCQMVRPEATRQTDADFLIQSLDEIQVLS